MERPTGAVAELAEQRGYGSHVVTAVLADVGSGCLIVIAPFVLVLVGTGLLVADGGPVTTAVGIALIVLAPVVAFLFWRVYSRTWARAPRLYCFEAGFILGGNGQLRPYAWNEVDVRKWSKTHLVGQAQSPQTFAYLDVRTEEGELLVTLGEANHLREVAELAARIS
ncbi:hypothetical protein [Micromonospora arborensis]|uniref:hypothetical protein n=1 Tax=Micromonospora arborensis TaxID=2116518 RepID=UPI0011B654CD|nr:hypothetical protein [Micromonospora arborensis]